MLQKILRLRSQSGTTIVEMVVAAAVTSMLMASLLIGVTTIRRSFVAAQHYATNQLEEARLIDYVTRDLRRALTVTPPYTYQGGERLDLTIPNYYQSDGTPYNPVIDKGLIRYGSTGSDLHISYYKNGTTIIRESGGVATEIVTDVQDFLLDFTDDGAQTVKISVTFVPRFQWSTSNQEKARAGTTAYSTTLLRNKRRFATPPPL